MERHQSYGPPAMLGRTKKKDGRVAGLVLLIAVLLFAAVAIGDYAFFARYFIVTVDGQSMENTVFDGDIVYADRSAAVARGEVVIIDVSGYEVFSDSPAVQNSVIIKRVIAVEGDSIFAADGIVYLKKAGENGYTELQEPYIKPFDANPYYKISFDEVTLSEGEIFVIGDNREVSRDSRRAGPLLADDVLGTVPVWAIENKKKITEWESFRMRVSSALASLIKPFRDLLGGNS